MNTDVLILFINATLVTVISCAAVIGILKKQYLPVIKEEEEKLKHAQKQEENNNTSNKDAKHDQGEGY